MPIKKVVRAKVKKQQPAPVLKDPFKTIDQDYTPPGKFILVYGEPGLGKTTVAAHIPDPLFITTSDERGILEAVQAKVVPDDVKEHILVLEPLCVPEQIPNGGGHPAWNTLMETMDVFIEGRHSRQSLVLDTASGLQAVCHQHTASDMYNGNMNDPKGFMNYHEGYLKSAEQYWNGQFLARCNRITATGRNVILICHATTLYVPNYGGSDYECFAPALKKGNKTDNIYDYTLKTVSAILFFGQHTMLTTDSKRKKVSSQHGFIGVRDQGWYKAKNWYDLRNEIPMGDSAKETWENISNVLPFN